MKSRPFDSRRTGFTLVELLGVIAIIGVIMALTAPAIQSLKGSQSTTRTIYQIASQLEQARAYAVSNNTYVLLGLAEVKAGSTQPPSPQSSGTGRLILSSVASKDGTKIFDETSSDIGADWKQKTAQDARLIQLGKLTYFENVHLSGTLEAQPGSALASRPAVETASQMGDPQCFSVLQFAYPVTSSSSSATCQFTKVIQFSPQGAASILRNDNVGVVAPWIELCLTPTRGAAAITDRNLAAIQVNGVTGSVAVYRP